MSDILVICFSGRLTKDSEIVSYGSEGKTLTRFSVASGVGTKDKPQAVFNNCTCFGKYGETIGKYFKQGDQIFITGVPTQNKTSDGKYYHGVNVTSWSFGAKKGGSSSESHEQPPREEEDQPNPFDAEDIPF